MALVSRRPWRAAVDEHAPAEVARVLRRLAADLLRCVFPDARHWRALPEPEAEPVVLTPLARLERGWGDAALLAALALEEGDAATAGEAAARLSRLAEVSRWPLLAAVFAEAAALASRKDGWRALRVATLARDRADHVAAEWWGQRTASLARTAGIWELAVFGYARAASALSELGKHAMAIRLRQREMLAAQRALNAQLQAQTLHYMAGTYWAAGMRPEARGCLASAVLLYGPGNPRLPVAAVDAAAMLLESGEAITAFPILRASVPLLENPRERVTGVVNLARACAELGDPPGFEGAAREALALYEQLGFGEGAAWGLGCLATACARHLEDPGRARRWARQAAALALERGEQAYLEAARSLLEVIGDD